MTAFPQFAISSIQNLPEFCTCLTAKQPHEIWWAAAQDLADLHIAAVFLQVEWGQSANLPHPVHLGIKKWLSHEWESHFLCLTSGC